MKQALSSIKVPSILEPNGLTRSDGKRPGGITLAPWEVGKQLVWDVTCVDLLAPSRIENGSVANPGTAAEDAEGKWSLGLMPFGLKSFGLIQLVTWPNFFKLTVSGIGHLS